MALACPLLSMELKNFSPCHLQHRNALAPQIATHLMSQLGQCAKGHRCQITLPSAMNLSGFYGCGVLDVLDALPILKQYHFDYRMDGIDGPLLIQDLKGHKRPLFHHIHWPTHF